MQLKYHCNFFETILLFIYITGLYWQKISTFYFVQSWSFGPEKTQTSLHKKKTGWHQWAIIFCVDVHMEP